MRCDENDDPVPRLELVQLSGQQKLIGTMFEQFKSKFPIELINIFRKEGFVDS